MHWLRGRLTMRTPLSIFAELGDFISINHQKTTSWGQLGSSAKCLQLSQRSRNFRDKIDLFPNISPKSAKSTKCLQLHIFPKKSANSTKMTFFAKTVPTRAFSCPKSCEKSLCHFRNRENTKNSIKLHLFVLKEVLFTFVPNSPLTQLTSLQRVVHTIAAPFNAVSAQQGSGTCSIKCFVALSKSRQIAEHTQTPSLEKAMKRRLVLQHKYKMS
jgi:hypothetical protein